jgi:pyrroloquinoline quinone (PQQ) biosynthesis protein C
MVAVTTLHDELRAALETRHCRHHPYSQMWRDGTLPREAIAGWVQEHSHFTKDIPWLNAVMPCRIPYADVRAAYHESINEKTDPADPHINILLCFGAAMGLDSEAVKQSKPLPTTQALLDWLFILSRHRSMVEVIAGAQVEIESQPPEKRWLYIDSIYVHYVLGYKLTDDRWHDYQAEYGPSPFYDAVC